MGCTAGKDGVVKLGNMKIGYLDNWNLAINNGTSEVSQMGNEWKEYCRTASDWSGSCSGTFDYADAEQKQIVDNIVKGTVIESPTLEFFVGATLSLTGKVVFTSLSITASHGDKIAFSLNFQGNGAIAPSEAA